MKRNGNPTTQVLQTSSMSVIIPAFNEAAYITETLQGLRAAQERYKDEANAAVQILVVDNASGDHTAELARSAGASVITEAEHNIAKVRNAGAAAALQDVLVFLDADTLVPPDLMIQIGRAMRDPACVGGAVDAVYRPNRLVMRAYLKMWRVIGFIGGMAQGACQFCRRNAFEELGGYDESWYMGEDVDFFRRMKRLARRRGLRTSFLREIQVIPSPRRFDRWPLWRTFLWTFPPLAFALRRRKAAWPGWYKDPPR